ncbi:hypothetical protein ABZ318_17805 [Streptomyces sp. NPDC006197]|uniref:hypothetical protein n=1 Tax=Streptomyces sp. NPDC006197 TaxID=3156685 RepID=UPI0033BADF50
MPRSTPTGTVGSTSTTSVGVSVLATGPMISVDVRELLDGRIGVVAGTPRGIRVRRRRV